MLILDEYGLKCIFDVRIVDQKSFENFCGIQSFYRLVHYVLVVVPFVELNVVIVGLKAN